MSMNLRILDPFSGSRNPQMVPQAKYSAAMNATDLQALLKGNLEAAIGHMERTLGQTLRHEDIAHRAGIGKGTVGRVLRKETCPAVDTLEALASVFGLRGWQLLIEGFRADEPPEIVTDELRLELDELRALAQQVEGLTRGRPNTSPRSSDARHRQGVRKKQKGRIQKSQPVRTTRTQEPPSAASPARALTRSVAPTSSRLP